MAKSTSRKPRRRASERKPESERKELIPFGKRVLRLRRALGHTQRTLAALLDMEPMLISRYERAIAFPSERTLPRLASALGCTVEALTTGRGLREAA